MQASAQILHSDARPTSARPAPISEARKRQLEDEITELAGHINAATFQLLELLREFDDCEGWSGAGLRSCAHWLNWKCGIALGAAREKVRVAHALKSLPAISASLRRGELSYSKVRAMTRVATARNEGALLEIARHGTATHVERHVRNFRRVKRIEALEAENTRHLHRELNWHFDDDGSWALRGRFTPEQGAAIQKALENVEQQLFNEQKNVPAGTPNESAAARRADALARMAQAAQSASPATSGNRDQFLAHIHIDLDALRQGGEVAEAEIEDGPNVCAETARRLCCDAGHVLWQEQGRGEPLSIGRKTRSVPPSIRRALQHRDGGCRFPGCSCNRFVDAHHIRHWADGGETALNNLVLLCRHHHRLVHEGGFGLEQTGISAFRFSRPDGHRIPDVPQTRSRGNVFELRARQRARGIEITPKTAQSLWAGEKMDEGMALDGLLRLE